MLEMLDKPIDVIGNVAVSGVVEINALEHTREMWQLN
jgi:hypothetical protein